MRLIEDAINNKTKLHNAFMHMHAIERKNKEAKESK